MCQQNQGDECGKGKMKSPSWRPRMPGSEIWNVFPETRSSILRLITGQDYAGWIRDRMGGGHNCLD